MQGTTLITSLLICTLAGCHRPSPSPPSPAPNSLHEVRDPSGNVIERDATSDTEPPPPPIAEPIPPKPYVTALYIRGYWYHDRPNHRWTWIKGYWR